MPYRVDKRNKKHTRLYDSMDQCDYLSTLLLGYQSSGLSKYYAEHFKVIILSAAVARAAAYIDVAHFRHIRSDEETFEVHWMQQSRVTCTRASYIYNT